MLWFVRRNTLAVIAAAGILATAGVAVQGRQQPAPEGAQEQAKPTPPQAAAAPDPAPNRTIAREQLTLIDEALASLHRMAENARVEISDPRFALWERRRMEALHKAGATKAEIVGALEKYIDILKAKETLAQRRKERALGTQVEIYDVQYRLQEARIWLNEEIAR